MNDKQQLAAMGVEMAEQKQQPMCMAKRIEELEAQVRVMAELLREAKPYMDHGNGSGVKGYIQISKKIDAALASKMPSHTEQPLAMVALSDIVSLQRYTLGGHCDDFGQDCGAEMEQDDEGEYILLAEALRLSATPKPEAK